MYLAARDQDLRVLKTVLDRVSAAELPASIDILSRLSPMGNTFLHVAATCGKKDTVAFISAIGDSQELQWRYRVAKAGDGSMVEALVQIHHDLPLPENAEDENNLLVIKNERGKPCMKPYSVVTIQLLHILSKNILRYHITETTKDNLCCIWQPMLICVSLILRLCSDGQRLNKLFKEKSPVRAAIKRYNFS